MEPNPGAEQSPNDNLPTSTLFKPSVLSVPTIQLTSSLPTPAPTSKITSADSDTNTAVPKPPTTDVPSSKSTGSDYVFGSNISSRVVNANVSQGASSILWTATSDNGDAAIPSSSMFTTLAKVVTVVKPANSNGNKNLEDSAKGVVEDKQREALSLAEVDHVTGEEGERQIVRQHCRAYVFDKDKQNWNSLGASQFHLNDIPNQTNDFTFSYPRSRVVVRLASTRRLIINSLIWSEMPLALVDPRSLRIGAINEEGNHVKSYLLVFPPDQSAVQIHDMLLSRKSRAASSSVDPSSTDSDKTSVSSRKRHSEEELDGIAQKVSIITPQSNNGVSSTSPKISLNSSIPTSRANIFRPSVLDSAGAHNFGANNQESSDSNFTGGDVQFRNSPLDAVVKRLKETTSSLPSDSGLSSTSSTCKVSNQTNPSPNLFEAKSLPVTVTAGTNNPTDFVFGHNISDRVVNTTSESQSGTVMVEPDSTNHQPDHTKSDSNENDDLGDFPANTHTLEESATIVLAEMREKSICSLPSLPERSFVTGEEGEYLTLRVFCQFYIFDRTTKEWNGRGKAYVHLNDIPIRSSPSADQADQSVRITSGPPARSRLVIRVCQTLKLLANIPIKSGLNLALADEHSIRLTALLYNTDQNIEDEKSCNTIQQSEEKPEFCAYLLVMKSNKEADRLYQAILSRLSTFAKRQYAEIDKNTEPVQSDSSPSTSCPSKLSRLDDSVSSPSCIDSESASAASTTTATTTN